MIWIGQDELHLSFEDPNRPNTYNELLALARWKVLDEVSGGGGGGGGAAAADTVQYTYPL